MSVMLPTEHQCLASISKMAIIMIHSDRYLSYRGNFISFKYYINRKSVYVVTVSDVTI